MKLPSTDKPLVSIGLFAYNAESFIHKSIGSLLNQSYKNIEIIISDNDSTDNTGVICQGIARQDDRIFYYKQPKNIGMVANCIFVLKKSKGAFFMWAAADDLKSKNFVEKNLDFLLRNPTYIASTSPVRFQQKIKNQRLMGDYSIDANSYRQRLKSCLINFPSNGRFFSLFRKEIILKSKILKDFDFFCADICFCLELFKYGKFKKIRDGYVILGKSGVSSTGKIYSMYRKSFKDWIFPLRNFSSYLLKLTIKESFSTKLFIYLFLIKQNLIYFIHQLKIEIFFLFKLNRKIKN